MVNDPEYNSPSAISVISSNMTLNDNELIPPGMVTNRLLQQWHNESNCKLFSFLFRISLLVTSVQFFKNIIFNQLS